MCVYLVSPLFSFHFIFLAFLHVFRYSFVDLDDNDGNDNTVTICKCTFCQAGPSTSFFYFSEFLLRFAPWSNSMTWCVREKVSRHRIMNVAGAYDTPPAALYSTSNSQRAINLCISLV